MGTLSLGEASDPEISPYAGAPGWKETKAERTQWFKDAKFGMFIHWGLYAPAGGYWPPNQETGKKYPQHYSEWIRNWANVSEPEYGKLTKPLFKPDPGCTDEWAKVAKDAGMKYTVLTTKHHDGYTLFNAKAAYSQNNDITGSTNISPKGRDMVAEYTDSVRKQGLKVGYYYSIIDWQHPHAVPQSRKWPVQKGTDHSEYVDYMHSHMKQLFTDYGKSDVIWVDYSSAQYQGAVWKTKKLLTKLHKLQPQALTNNRFWNGLQNANGDFFTPEKYVPATGFPGRMFEVCHTMNESFGYSHHDTHWKNSKDIVQMLVDIVSKGGNLLLNVGPDAQGHIPEQSAKVLRETGQWLKVYGDAIYGTDASPFAELGFDGRCTSKQVKGGKTNLYLHLFSWPEDGKLALPALDNKIHAAVLMGSKTKLNVKSGEQGLVIQLPSKANNEVCSVVAIQIEGKPKVNALMSMPQQKADRSVMIPVDQAQIEGPQIRIERTKGTAHIGYWVDIKSTVALSFNVNSPGPVQAGGVVTRKPGKYAVYANYATEDKSGGKLRLSTVDNQTLDAEIKATGSWQDFKRLKLGEIILKDTGETKIKLQATKVKGKGFLNLQSLELIPLN